MLEGINVKVIFTLEIVWDRQQTPNANAPPPPPPVHQDDADEDDETVEHLNECSSVYLSLQECLINTDRNCKSQGTRRVMKEDRKTRS
ncbi:hypothetical protein K7X08_008485 [Anisodus acutangulus]|uniref:Uncharacterized protein n=1 Tax=Anisodus acutangulus TaxID=402998 RepID=A0A9Q1RNW9_9SOLA|nr:hypothetical protein K7X08_008485 [Anisodus acutangulus]